MRRSVAALTMLAVLGPRHSESAISRSFSTVPGTSKGVSLMAAITRPRAS